METFWIKKRTAASSIYPLKKKNNQMAHLCDFCHFVSCASVKGGPVEYLCTTAVADKDLLALLWPHHVISTSQFVEEYRSIM